MLETNKHPRGACNIALGKGGRITDEKGVFIQTQNIIVSLKVLVSVKCLITFVHDCRCRWIVFSFFFTFIVTLKIKSGWKKVSLFSKEVKMLEV